MFVKISGPDQTPISNESGDVSTIPGIIGSDEIRITGKTTEIKLIRTIEVEKKKTIQNNGLLEFRCKSGKLLRLLLYHKIYSVLLE